MLRKSSIIFFSLLTFTTCSQSAQNGQLPWWAWLLIILLLALIFWMVFRKEPEEVVKTTRAPEEVLVVDEEQPTETAAPQAETEDNLKMIEGIGPKIESVLKAAGIRSFSQLAQMDAASLSTILSEAGVRLGFPDTWPEQARLAAKGEMDALKAFQDELSGGRK
jgi:predicted flap endonuclease-1-like 5' DNA nuclease